MSVSVDDWLDQFEMFSIYEILPEILELWGAKLLAQKQQLLQKEISETSEKLNALKEADKQAKVQLENGELGHKDEQSAAHNNRWNDNCRYIGICHNVRRSCDIFIISKKINNIKKA